MLLVSKIALLTKFSLEPERLIAGTGGPYTEQIAEAWLEHERLIVGTGAPYTDEFV